LSFFYKLRVLLQNRNHLNHRIDSPTFLSYLNRARYHGSCKNLFDLRYTAVVHNLHVIAKIVAQAEKQIAASGG